eukprot:c32625_g1_i1.p2 GENE.c32625_g1_i1~~c32625_g1_i1.p2  ORF type:complete len:226 (-),score=48.69 c32625_g1_i1:164-841(-)
MAQESSMDEGPSAPSSLEFLFKVILVGEEGTGKTAIINRYVRDQFKDLRATIGVDFALKVLKLDENTVVRLQLWDIAGQERYGRMLRVYFKSAVAGFVVFDVTRRASFERAKNWKRDIDEKVHLADGTNVPVVLLANKCDRDDIDVNLDPVEMQRFCDEFGFAGWFETSAKTGVGIAEAGKFLVHKILENEARACRSPTAKIVDPNMVHLMPTAPAPKEEKCCRS